MKLWSYFKDIFHVDTQVAVRAVGTDSTDIASNRVIAVDKSSQKEILGAAFVSADFTEQQFRRYLTRILRNETPDGKATVSRFI